MANRHTDNSFFLTIAYIHKPISTRHIFLGFLPFIISAFIVFWEDITVRPYTSKELTIEAHYMQYACGDWVDDMNVSKVGDTNYNWLIGKDIDPVFYLGDKVINDMFYSDDTSNNVYKSDSRMRGYMSEESCSGCENSSPRFWITDLEKLDGSEFKRSGNNSIN